ncbi:hypothetical protein LTR64_008294 [Lithohypha guttulata]|uniref:uncharacterized protein n=1 Tax=Lithohypha guttulata TaxID=1690604 RepID=UPI002DDE4B5A|nr:hypothetical protein LTR51_008446 [Lithohypha guttulata]
MKDASLSVNREMELTNAILPLARLALLGCALFVLYKIFETSVFTYRTHTGYKDLPQHPRHWFWGHLATIGPKLNPSINAHPDYAFEDVWHELGNPPAYVVDLAPVDRAMIIIADPTVAESITQPTERFRHSTPALTKLVGKQSLVLIEGDNWRTQRRRFNKGFAPAHLHSLVPLIVSKTRIFLDRLKKHVEKGDAFPLKELTTDLTIDVITQVAIDKDFHAQTLGDGEGAKSRFGLLTAIVTMSTLIEKVGQGFDLGAYLFPQRRIKEWIYDRIYSRALYTEIIDKLPSSKRTSEKSDTGSGKSIVNLALSGVNPTPAVLDSTISQVKTFLFAGQDTTSTVIQWMAYELSKSYPSSPFYSDHYRQIRERLCAEHDEVFGASDPFALLDILERDNTNADELLGSKLPYTTAFVKETLRLHPPAGSARLVPMAPYDPTYPANKSNAPYYIDLPAWTHSKTGEHFEARKVRADGARFYNSHHIIHRNPTTWGPDALTFDPSRFLDRSGKGTVDELEEALDTSSKEMNSAAAKHNSKTNLPHPYHISTLPTGSYRPFERGPRTCIGSNLAYLEAKIVLGVIARGFEWQKVGLDGTRPKPGEVRYGGTGKEDIKLGEAHGWEVWSINNVTAVPVDAMKMRAKLRGR